MRWKIFRINKIPDSLKNTFHVLTAAPDYFSQDPIQIEVFPFSFHHDPMRRVSSDSSSLAPQHEMTEELRQDKCMTSPHFFSKFQFSSWSQRGPTMPLPTSTEMVLKELSTSSQSLPVGK